jgi:FAD/FMN-containing dehydrogenase
MATTTATGAELVSDEFRAAFRGTLFEPGDVGYDEARAVYNGMIDRRPRLVARCADSADVIAAVNLARETGTPLAIRGGGHNAGGLGTWDDAVVVDLSAIRAVRVDPASQTIRVEGGATWGDVDHAGYPFGLTVPSGFISTTGVGGLTLGGGLGYLTRQYGFTVDSLLSADVVLADGSVVTTSADEHPDLFWGIRGGGGNFGVVTSFEFELHEVGPTITGGLIVHAFDDARDLLRFAREFAADLPDELMIVAALVHAPDGSGTKVAGVAVCHSGPEDQAQRDLAPLLGFGSPIDVQIGPMPYEIINQMLDDAFPPGVLNHWKSTFLESLSDEAIDTLIERFAAAPSPMTNLALEHFHGAATRVPVDATACQHRTEGWNLLTTSIWTDPDETEENVAWTRDTLAAITPHAANRRWIGYLDRDDYAADPAAAGYGPNYERLVEVKNAYDPTNLFRLNLNVKPSA